MHDPTEEGWRLSYAHRPTGTADYGLGRTE